MKARSPNPKNYDTGYSSTLRKLKSGKFVIEEFQEELESLKHLDAFDQGSLKAVSDFELSMSKKRKPFH